MNIKNISSFCILFLTIFLFSCNSVNYSFIQKKSVPQIQRTSVEESYKLGAGDKLKVTVFGEESLSGEFEVDGQGIVSLPLVNNIEAGGKDVREFEKIVTAKLADGYLVKPRVSVEVLNFRPFFILGEVKKPGSYPYVNGLTVLNAIALAGGYNYRARTDRVLIRDNSNNSKNEFEADEDIKVMPGDIIRVTERFF